ncbi:putative porin [Acinetobacter towneri]|uniref:putative porin n=1 Tax=Acinetobacter towneri TaxID=202956 RepID=UPI001CE0D565|nr:putative porin [Acinetobacter towneri]MCA4779869.1 putative porin [Acinetobacter towneri]MCA4785223.1 putative porin [Acinetobacter towneri]MCA4786099.1 putative porin [Acinetobacter towneri]MCA4796516.1 putative porin [Acinetobacter towneri]MCA4801555.1 putative porin [Acinetobacter towneri]
MAVATALLAGLSTAHAYQAEIGGSLLVIDPDYENADTSTGFALDGTFYFNPVQVKNSPLNEAAFLNRASNVNAEISYIDFDVAESTSFGIGVEYFVPNTDFYVSAGIGQTTVEFDGFDFDTTNYTAELGYLPVSGLLIAAGIVGFDNDEADNTDATLRAKYVTQVGAYDMNFEGGVVFADDEMFTLGTDLYLDKTFSIGLGYTDDGEDDTFQIRAKKFFNQQVSLEGSINFEENANVFGLRAAYRF